MHTVRNRSETIMEYIMVLFGLFLEVERKTKQHELCVVMETRFVQDTKDELHYTFVCFHYYIVGAGFVIVISLSL